MMHHRSDLPPVDPQLWAAVIPSDSFYARLSMVRDLLVDDQTYASLYKASPKGRPSIPPSLVVLTMLLQYHDDCSDRETEARAPGQTHLNRLEDLEEIIGVPASFLPFTFDAHALGLLLP